MPVRLHHIVVDAHDLPGLARFWTQALGWKILSERDREIVIGPEQSAPVGMCFMPVPDAKTVKNRVHIDVAPDKGEDQAAAVRRLQEAGAVPADVGQGADVSWVVLAGPDGNEFCVLTPR